MALFFVLNKFSGLKSVRTNMSKTVKLLLMILLVLVAQWGHSQMFRPYDCGPVLKKNQIQTFDTLNQYLGLGPGMTFAEVGASSGYYNGAMAVYSDSVTYYLQDIDEDCLNEENLQKVLKHYSKFRKGSITNTNDFHIVIGTETKTNLPENTFDVVFTNGTFHVLNYPDSIISDIHKSLKIDGTLAIRDEFIFEDKVVPCKDAACVNPLTKYEDFIVIMERNNFKLEDREDRFGYPVFKFTKSR